MFLYAVDVACSVQILLLNNIDELYEHIDRTQLTADLGGNLQYDHQQWIQHRAVRHFFLLPSNYLYHLMRQSGYQNRKNTR